MNENSEILFIVKQFLCIFHKPDILARLFALPEFLWPRLRI